MSASGVPSGAVSAPVAPLSRTDGPSGTDAELPTAPEMHVRSYRPGDEHALVAMFSSIFRKRTLDEWTWLFRNGPHGPADIHILESEGATIGSVSHIPVDVWVRGKKLKLAIGCDVMVLREYRGQGGAEMLFRHYFASEHGVDMNFGTVNDGSSHVTRRQMGTTTMGGAPIWIRRRSGGRSAKAIIRRLESAAERLYGAAVSWPRPALEVAELEELGAEVDELADASAAFAPCIRVRDSEYLRWIWLENPMAHWRARAVRGPDGALRGLSVIGVKDEDGRRVGYIMELLARDAAALRALVLDAWARLGADGCERVVCLYQDPRPWARRAMLRCGFRSVRGPRIACGPLSPRADDLVGRLESWYLTGGDADV